MDYKEKLPPGDSASFTFSRNVTCPLSNQKTQVLRFFQAFGIQDLRGLRSLVRDDVRWWVPISAERRGIHRPLSGWDSIPWFNGSFAFEPQTTTWKVFHLVEEADYVAVHMSREATIKGDALFDNEYNWLFRLENDQIAEVWEILDTATAFSALDNVSAPKRW